jgi:hypothetical protein
MNKDLSAQAKRMASKTYIDLFNYIINIPNGTLVEYSAVERDTGIEMLPKNKARLHDVCKASGREYLLVKGIGYQLADGHNAITIVNTGINKVGHSIVRLKKTHINIKIDIYQEMTSEDKQKFLFTESVTNAINESISSGLRSKPKMREIVESKPLLP